MISVSVLTSLEADELPLLGEAFAVEFANTRYVGLGSTLDFLADGDAVALWFAHAVADLPVPAPLNNTIVRRLRRVRDATRLLLQDLAVGMASEGTRSAAEVLHREAQSASSHLALRVADQWPPRWELHHDTADHDGFLTAVASRCILFLGGEDTERIRRCVRPGCPMMFVQHHRSRRYCHESCAHSVRQARYYRSTRNTRPTSPEPTEPSPSPSGGHT